VFFFFSLQGIVKAIRFLLLYKQTSSVAWSWWKFKTWKPYCSSWNSLSGYSTFRKSLRGMHRSSGFCFSISRFRRS
jgi:hypothetical protein